MPIYKYRCPHCKLEVESLRIPGTKTLSCPCGGAMIKIPSKSNFILKGNGWTEKGK